MNCTKLYECESLTFLLPSILNRNVHSPAISSVPNFMWSTAGDSELEGFKGWLFLAYWPFRYLCQGSLLTSPAVLTWSGVSRKTTWLWFPFTNVENQIFKFSNSWNHWKFREILSIRQLNIIKNSGVLKTRLGQDGRNVWGLRQLSKWCGSRFSKVHSGNRSPCPES